MIIHSMEQFRRSRNSSKHTWKFTIHKGELKGQRKTDRPGKSHGRRSLVGCSPWGREELDMNERLHFHFSLSCIEGGNSNQLQCSCLKNPRDGGAQWASIYGVAQSWTTTEAT